MDNWLTPTRLSSNNMDDTGFPSSEVVVCFKCTAKSFMYLMQSSTYSEGLKSHQLFWGSIVPMRGSRCDPFTSWSHQLCQIACGKPVFLMVLEQENFEIFQDLCCKTYVFTLVEVQEEGFWLDFDGFCSCRPGEHTMPAYRMKFKTSRVWPWDLMEFLGMQWNTLESIY